MTTGRLFLKLLLAVIVLVAAPSAALALEVVNVMPEGQVTDLGQITVRFSSPVQPLGDATPAAVPLVLTPDTGRLPKGNFRWVDPATLAYIFDEPVMCPLTITAHVPKGTRALDGTTLAAGKAWRVSTPPLTLALARADELPRTKAELILRANYPLSIAQVRTRVTLHRGNSPLVVTSVKERVAAYGTQGRPSAWDYIVAVRGPLSKNSAVTAVLAPGLTALAGGAPLGRQTFSVPTYKDLRLRAWNVAGRDAAQNAPVPPDEDIFVSFTNPVRYANLLARLTVTPPAVRSDDLAPQADMVGQTFPLPFRWEPRTTYTVTLAAGLTDTFGTTLPARENFSFTTGDRAPFLFFPQGGLVLEAPLGNRFPLRARNMGMVTARLRYAPWGDEAYRTLRDEKVKETPAFLHEPGTRETILAFATAEIPNQTLSRLLDIPAALGFASPGPVPGLLTLDVDATGKNDGVDTDTQKSFHSAAIQVTDLSLAVRMGGRSGIAWLTGMTQGQAEVGARVSLLDATGRTLWQGGTDALGRALLPGYDAFPGTIRFCKAETATDSLVLDLAAAGLPKTTVPREVRRAHVVSQLPLYRPGQGVNAVLFLQGAMPDTGGQPRWRVLAGERVRLRVEDRNRRAVHSTEGVTNAYGTLPLAFTLKDDAEPGPYQVIVEPADHPGTLAGRPEILAARPFSVASFRPPDFKVDLTPPASQPVPLRKAPPLRLGLAAGYFSGAALPGGGVTVTGEARASLFAPERLAGYATGPAIPPYRYFDRRVLDSFSLAATLDAAGNATLSLPAITTGRGQPAEVALTATVTDAATLASQGAASFVLHPSAYYIGLRTPFMVPQGQRAELGLKAATWNNAPLTGTSARIEARRAVPGKDGREAEELVWKKDVVIAGEHGDTIEAVFTQSGLYILTASLTDSDGRDNIAQARVYVPGPDLAWSGGHQGRHLELLAEPREYAPGETARIVLKNPFPEGANALVTIERDGILRSFSENMRGPAPVLSIPLEAGDAPGIRVAVTLMRGRTAPPPDSNGDDMPPDAGAPALATGDAALTVGGKAAPLAVTVTTDAANYRPGAQVTATVRATDASGKGKKAQITLLAVDERYLRAAGDATAWDPAQTFRPLSPRAVRQADSLRLLLSRAVPVLRQEGRSFLAMPAAGNAAKFAAPVMDGATPPGAADAPLLRHDFSPLVHWLAAGETDEAGILSATFSLPHTLTSHRIVALAADMEATFALGSRTVTATQPLQLLSALPRFVTEGDALDAAFLVNNTSLTRETVTVTARASGALLGETTRTITLDAGRSGTVFFPLTVAGLSRPWGEMALDVAARMGAETDAMHIALPVKPARSLTVTAAAGTLAEGERIAIPAAIPAPLDERGGLTVTFAASPAAGAIGAAAQLLDYPWNCLEQELSRAWARAIRLRHGELLGLEPDKTDRDRLAIAMQAIVDRQKEDGSFSLWPGMDGTTNSLFLTAYALLVARDAEAAGVPLPTPVRTKALTYLENTVTAQAKASGNALADAVVNPLARPPEEYAVALAALALHTPRKASPFLPGILALCEEKGVTPLGWGALLLTMNAVGPLPDAPALTARITAALEKTAAVTATALHFASPADSGAWRTFGSTLRDNGLVLGSLAETVPGYPRLDNLARWVGQRLGDTKTLSTQEAAFGLWGLAVYAQRVGGQGETSVTAVWDGKDEASVTFRRPSDPPVAWNIPAATLDGGKTGTLNLTGVTGRAYWTARLAFASPATASNGENAGITLAESAMPALAVGDTHTVTLTMSVAATRRHVLLFAPFPAGVEPLYATRADLDARNRKWQAPWQWQDALDDGMLLYAPVVHPGTYSYTYTVRAMASGSFTKRPARAEEMYAPEVFGSTKAETVTVLPR